MNAEVRWLVRCSLALCLVACTNSSGRDPADARDAASEVADAAILDAARDGAPMQPDAGGDANQSNDDDASVTDAASPSASLESFVYVGGWGDGNYPVKTYGLNRTTGELTELNTSTAFGPQPSFIKPNADGTLLYMTNESGSAAGITIANIDAITGLPSKLDQRSDSGGGFVHAAISPNKKVLLAADYNDGRLVDFPIGSDGKLGAAVSTISFGNSANTHSSSFHPSGLWAYAPNKGLDIIGQFAVDASTGALSRLADLHTQGDGPRMITITPDGKYAYVMFENDGSVGAYAIGNDGLLSPVDREDSLPNERWGGHALVHPNGKFLYVSTRNTSSIVVFTIAGDGSITQLDHLASEGKTPRCFDIDASGKWLVVANQGDNDQAAVGSLAVFSIGSDGKLTKRGTPIGNLKAPTAVALVTRAKH